MDFTALQTAVKNRCALVTNDAMVGTANTGALALLVNAGLHWYETDNPNGWDWLIENDGTLSTAASTELYDFSDFTTDNPIAKIIELKLAVSGGTPYPVDRVSKQEADALYPVTGTSCPEVYYVQGQQVGFRPIPDGVYAITATIVGTEPDLSASDDEPVLPVRFHEMIVEAAAYLFYRREQNTQKAGEALAAYKDWRMRALANGRPHRGPGRVRADAEWERV